MFVWVRRNVTPVKSGLENDPEVVAKNLEDGLDIEYYYIKVLSNNATLTRVNLKAGPRTSGPVTEVAEIEAGPEGVVGSAVVPV